MKLLHNPNQKDNLMNKKKRSLLSSTIMSLTLFGLGCGVSQEESATESPGDRSIREQNVSNSQQELAGNQSLTESEASIATCRMDVHDGCREGAVTCAVRCCDGCLAKTTLFRCGTGDCDNWSWAVCYVHGTRSAVRWEYTPNDFNHCD